MSKSSGAENVDNSKPATFLISARLARTRDHVIDEEGQRRDRLVTRHQNRRAGIA